MDAAQKAKLDNYLIKNLGVRLSDILGHTVSLKRDITAIMFVNPPQHSPYNYTINHRIRIKKGALIKIIKPQNPEFQPVGYSNSLYCEVQNSFIEIGCIKCDMEELINASQ